MTIEFEAVGDCCIKQKMPKGFPILKVLALCIVVGLQLIRFIDTSHIMIIIINKARDQKLFGRLITKDLS